MKSKSNFENTGRIMAEVAGLDRRKNMEFADDLEFDEYIKNLPKIGSRTEAGKFLYPNSIDPWDEKGKTNAE